MSKGKNRKGKTTRPKVEFEHQILATDSQEVVKSKLQRQADTLYNTLMQKNLNMAFDSSSKAKDAFTNSLARMGFGQPNITEATEYPLTRMSYNWNLFISIYRSSWIARKIIDTLPADMLKNWVKVSSGMEPDQIKKFEKTARNTRTVDKLKEGLQWGRLFGGAAGLIIIDGQEDILDQPLDYDLIMPDSYKGILVFDRWSGVYPSLDLVSDISDPDFGLPEYYTIVLNNSDGIDLKKVATSNDGMKVHHSRILRFTGRNLPFWEKQQEWYWGESEVEVIFEELKKRDNTSFNIASLVFLANIRVLKMDQLGQGIAVGGEQNNIELNNVLEAQNQLMNNMGMYVMDKEDSLETHQYSFSGLDEIYQSFMLDVAGAAEMPVTKIFGREPSGFNSTGEGDMKQYTDTVEEKQRTFLTPLLDKLLPIICLSSIGAIPDDFDWDYNPVQSIDNKDLADLAGTYTSNILDAYNAGIISKEIALKELKQQSELTGMWTNITDEYIEEAANNDTDVSGEDMSDLQNEITNGGSENGSDKQKESGKVNINEDKESASVIEPESWRDRVQRLFVKH